jgi:hypothetical protein
MRIASDRLDGAPQDTEDLRAVEADDLARKVEFLLSAAKAAAPAGQNAAPAAEKAVADTHTGGEHPADPLSTEQLDSLIRGTQLPPPSDPGTTAALGSIPRARSWPTLSVCLILAAAGSAALFLFVTEGRPPVWNVGTSPTVAGAPPVAPSIEVPTAVASTSEPLSVATANVAPGPEITNATASTAVAPMGGTPSTAAPPAAVSNAKTPIAARAIPAVETTAPPAAEMPIAAVSTAAMPRNQADGGPAGNVARHFNSDDIVRFSKRGKELLKAGDVAAARLALQRAAEAGDPDAALALGQTYDPFVLGGLGVHGIVADREAARTWYKKAQALGVVEAARRLEALANPDAR